MQKIHCALLSADDLFVKMVEIEPGQLTDRHLTTITECDLEPWKYRWVANAKNSFGGAFWPLANMTALRAAEQEVNSVAA